MNQDEALFVALYRLQVDYWYEVDHNGGRDATKFFAADGSFVVGTQTMAGHAEIAAFYAWRMQRGERTARHVVSNCRLDGASGDEAGFQCVMMLYADDGTPVLPARAPVMVADVTDRCVRVDGVWRFRSHVLRTIFQGGVQPTIPTRSDLQRHTAPA